MIQAQEQARIDAARNVVARFMPLLNTLRGKWAANLIQTPDACFISPVREALAEVGAAVAKDYEGRRYMYGRFAGMNAMLAGYMPGSRLHEALELLTGKIADVLNTDSAIWIEAQADEVQDIVELLEQVIAGDNPQCREAA